MKKIILVLLIAAGCTPNDPVTNSDMIIGRTWKTYAYTRNGTADAAVVAQQPTFEFRNDGKVYFSQIGPSFKDTFSYSFIDQTNIRLTKAAVPGYSINLLVDAISSTNFDFTLTNNQTATVDRYKTQKQ